MTSRDCAGEQKAKDTEIRRLTIESLRCDGDIDILRVNASCPRCQLQLANESETSRYLTLEGMLRSPTAHILDDLCLEVNMRGS